MRRRLASALVLLATTFGLLLGGLGPLPGAGAAPAAPAAPSGCGTAFPRYDRAPVTATTRVLADQPIRMSDGTVLRADVTLPAGVRGPFPTALTITGYGKSSPVSGVAGAAGPLVQRGYATVLVDDRGTGASEGTWDSWGPRTVADYDEVLDWVVAQPWSDGRIGLTGTSYLAITSIYAAATQHPAVRAVFAVVPMADGYRDIVFGGGQVNTAFIPSWMGLVTGMGVLANRDGQALADHLAGLTQFQLPTLLDASAGGAMAYDGPFWRQRSPIEVADRITVPTFVVGGLDDIFQRGEPMLYERLADHTDARLLIGPWTHGSVGSGLPRNGVPSLDALQLQWFDQHVLGRPAGAECIPPVTQYVRGLERYRSAAAWPLPGLTTQRWFLRGDGGLTATAPAAGELGRWQTSLPGAGLCSRSTNQWLIGAVDGLPCTKDERLAEVGALTYTSAPVATATTIDGPIQADVWITSDRPDAAVSVALSDVAPDGTVRGLTNGMLLASHRTVDPARSRTIGGVSVQPWHPFTAVARQAVVPGRAVLLPIEVFPTSAVLRPGHRLRVTISPYDVPHAIPPVPAALDTLLAGVTILNDAAHPSSVVLPVLPTPARVSAAGAPRTPTRSSAVVAGWQALAALPTPPWLRRP